MPPPRAAWAALALLVLAGAVRAEPAEEVVTPAGERVASALDSLHVETRWLAGGYVDWRSGDPKPGPPPPDGIHSHCSAFAAAAAGRLGVHLLEPPQHSPVQLADAQCAWLEGAGRLEGWKRVASPVVAQRRANRGLLVVACYASHRRDLPGHIAIVRPAAKSRSEIEAEGPQIIQAGVENYASASLAQGFAHHPRAWGRREVRFYSHELPER
jgi:hypothetical protein